MFDGAADTYDQSGVPFFGPIAEGLVRRLAPAAGERILDVGSGRGAATLPLSEAVSARGSVTAVDASGRMVELLSATLAERRASNVTVQQGDATAPPAGPYDVACASLLLFFLPDPVAGFTEVRTEREVFEVPYRDVRQFRAWSMGTALRGLWMHVPEEQVPTAMERIDAVLEERGYTLEVDIRYTLASG